MQRRVTTANKITVQSCPWTNEAPLCPVGALDSETVVDGNELAGTIVGGNELAGTTAVGDELDHTTLGFDICDIEGRVDGGRLGGPEI